MTDILLVEDEPNIAEAIRFLLSRDGRQIELWHEGGAALDRIRALKPKLVILDVMLPARSGIEVLEALRADPALGRTQVLLLTARGLTEDQTTRSGMADRILSKPFDNGELRRVVSEMLGAPG